MTCGNAISLQLAAWRDTLEWMLPRTDVLVTGQTATNIDVSQTLSNAWTACVGSPQRRRQRIMPEPNP